MKIKNREKLLSTGDRIGRRIVLDIAEKALRTIDSYHVLSKIIRLKGDLLQVGDCSWDLREKENIYVIGAGKAGSAMARAVEACLGSRITAGIVIVKQIDSQDALRCIELVPGGHPLPNMAGYEAAKRILKLVDRATGADLFLGLISGGSSALMACPIPGISLADEIAATECLLNSGARILEINAVRRHISDTNGGRLAERIALKGAEMINLVISDVVDPHLKSDLHHPVAYFGTPVAPDQTTITDACRTIEKYNLLEAMPKAITDHLTAGGPERETPKKFDSRILHFVIQEPADAAEAAKTAAHAVGVPSWVLTTFLEGESREAGTFLAGVVKEISARQRPVVPPCVLIASGETTTRIDRAGGHGGPSQELALGFALELAYLPGSSLIALDTDGTDGPTACAGGIVDAQTVKRAEAIGLNVYECLMEHNSHTVFQALGDELITGNTGTNVCDLNIAYVPGRLITKNGRVTH